MSVIWPREKCLRKSASLMVGGRPLTKIRDGSMRGNEEGLASSCSGWKGPQLSFSPLADVASDCEQENVGQKDGEDDDGRLVLGQRT